MAKTNRKRQTTLSATFEECFVDTFETIGGSQPHGHVKENLYDQSDTI